MGAVNTHLNLHPVASVDKPRRQPSDHVQSRPFVFRTQVIHDISRTRFGGAVLCDESFS